MFGIPIHHYAIVDFENFESIIDIAFPDGVKIDVKREMSEKIGVTLLPGEQRLNGKELLGYARFELTNKGILAEWRGKEVMSAVKEEAMRPGMLLHVPQLSGALSGFIKTDLTSKDEISKALTLLMNGKADLQTMTIPVEGTYRFNSYSHAGSVIELDIEKNTEALAAFLDMKLE